MHNYIYSCLGPGGRAKEKATKKVLGSVGWQTDVYPVGSGTTPTCPTSTQTLLAPGVHRPRGTKSRRAQYPRAKWVARTPGTPGATACHAHHTRGLCRAQHNRGSTSGSDEPPPLTRRRSLGLPLAIKIGLAQSSGSHQSRAEQRTTVTDSASGSAVQHGRAVRVYSNERVWKTETTRDLRQDEQGVCGDYRACLDGRAHTAPRPPSLQASQAHSSRVHVPRPRRTKKTIRRDCRSGSTQAAHTLPVEAMLLPPSTWSVPPTVIVRLRAQPLRGVAGASA